jgi:hypothetical protein
MVDAIGSSSTDWTRALDGDDDEVRRRAAAASTTKVATAPPEIPLGPDTDGALLVRAAQAQASAVTPKPLLAMGIDASIARTPDQDTVVQKRMDQFFARATPTYRLPAGDGKAIEVAVATPFRMPAKAAVRPGETDETTLRYAAQEDRVGKHATELAVIAGKVGLRPAELGAIEVGRGTPGQVQALTQALIDANKLPPPVEGEPSALRVRRMMCDYGIGFDCAGYVQQAFVAARGITRAQAGLAPDMTDEDLSHLSPTRFSRVPVEEARAGDVLALGPPPGSHEVGHRLLVFDRHDASPEEIARYCRAGTSLDGSHLTVLSVDSSFGSSALPEKGGVQRQTWLYDGKSWGTVIPAKAENGRSIPERVAVHDQPYDGQHRLLGVYHYKGSP